MVAHRCSLDVMVATWTRSAWMFLAVICIAVDTGRGGQVVAISWTAWDSSGLAVELAVKEGGKEGVLHYFALMLTVVGGQGNKRAGSGGDRGVRWGHGGGQGVLVL